MSNSVKIINNIRETLISKFNLSDTLTTNELIRQAIILDPSKRSIYLRIVNLINQYSLEDYQIKSLNMMAKAIK